MNSSRFMDKQIMDLSNSENNNGNNNFVDLINHRPQEDHHHHAGGGDAGAKTDVIFPNYDFQSIRHLSSSQPSNFDSGKVGGTRVWSSAESKTNSGIRNYGSLDSVEPAKAVVEKDGDAYDAALLSKIDRTMKKHADNLIHALEGISARLSQLESRSSHLENSVDDLKASIGNNHGSTDGKLRQIENIIREVQNGVEVVKDKQEILEAQLHLSKVQASKIDQQSQTQIPQHTPPMQPQQQPGSTPLQSHPTQSLPPPISNTPYPPTPTPTPQNLPPTLNHPNQFPHHDPYYPPPTQTPETPPHHYQPPPPQAPPPPLQVTPSQQPPYQPPQYSQPPPMAQQHPSLSNEEPSPPLPPPYLQSHNFPPSIAPSHQFYANPTQLYEPPSNRPGSGFPTQYGPPSGHNEPYPYGTGSPMKSQQHSAPNMGPSGSSAYPQLPTARILPQALPTASGVSGSGLGSGNSENRVPIDDVVDKVTNMGFPRDQVRAIVRKLTENGQAVDLNVVLDKVMNDEGSRGWFGR